MKILPSLASADVLRLSQEIDNIKDWPWIHFDIEDGNFTPNMTFGQKMLKSAGAYVAPRRLDVHLMVTDPMAFLAPARDSGAGSICAHLEALRFPMLFLNSARQMGMKAGLALNIGTPLSAIEPFIEQMDYLLVMTAEPDAEGEQFHRHAFEKALTAARTLPIEVYADGALTREKVMELHRAGAAGCVLGRLVFKAEDPHQRLLELTAEMEKA